MHLHAAVRVRLFSKFRRAYFAEWVLVLRSLLASEPFLYFAELTRRYLVRVLTCEAWRGINAGAFLRMRDAAVP